MAIVIVWLRISDMLNIYAMTNNVENYKNFFIMGP